jgi:phospholipid N-methyltransferase
MPINDKARFVGEFLSKPRSVGAIAPSSARLARRMIDWIDWPNVNTVIEYGPGTGAFTPHILARLRPDARFMAIEINPAFADTLARRFPEISIHRESVADVRAICDREGIDSVDAVVCGLPWASFADDQQSEYLEAMMTVLRPGGRFATFAYLSGLLLTAGRRFRRRLRDHFSQVDTSETVWRNLPPAFAYRCRR